MTFDQALTRMEALLEEERQAIRRIDADRIVSLSDEKEALMQAMGADDLAGRADLHDRFRSVVAGLRDNGVLLVHARNCVRDVIQLMAPATSSTYGSSGARPAGPGRRLSVNL